MSAAAQRDLRSAQAPDLGSGDCHARLRAIFDRFAGFAGPAYRHRRQEVSFRELHAAVLGLAAALARHPRMAERRPVLIWGHKDPRYMVAYWACLLAGQALVPVEPETPPERLRQIIASCDPALLLFAQEDAAMQERIRPVLQACGCDLMPVAPPGMPRAGGALPAAGPALAPHRGTDRDVAYIMFSSGTLGAPKGIQVTYANLLDFIDWLDPLLGRHPDAGAVSGNIRHCFDVSLFELWTSWTRGLPICTLDHGDVADSTGYIERLAASGAALWVSTPSLTRMILRNRRFCARTLPGLKTFLFCGEPLTKQICAALFERFDGCRILNTYGPTECTVAVSATEITPEMLGKAGDLPIGRARPGTEMRLAPQTAPGAAGEIWISGRSVGAGYLGLPEKQAAAFPEPGLYRSGDRGLETADGQWHFLGRIDREVKIQGLRVDLNDIEAHLRACPGVEDAAVEPHFLHGEARALQAFVLGPEGEAALVALAGKLASELPPHLVPRFWFAGFPSRLNLNSKLDRKELVAAAQAAQWRHLHMSEPHPAQREISQ
ncbi:MAG: AMP-binding protein [Paenirhodobacter sp.]|uniref:AMP-binding protein n=1 Tax=Paenirhodobacter sp. TaxID=1965326 RepID=UPI003D0ADAEE